MKPFIPARYTPDRFLPISIPGFGLVVALVFITLLGFLTANLAGRTFVAWGESLLARMPLIRNLYRGLKQIFETVLSNRSKSFQTVGLVEYPRGPLVARLHRHPYERRDRANGSARRRTES